MAERNALRMPATLLFIGLLLYALGTYLHAMIDAANKAGNSNNHPAVLTAIATGHWPLALP